MLEKLNIYYQETGLRNIPQKHWVFTALKKQYTGCRCHTIMDFLKKHWL